VAAIACHIRATASPGTLPGLAKFGLHTSSHRIGELVLPITRGVQVDQRGPAGGMTHPFHQFAKIGTGLSDQDIASVAQVVKMNVNA
jgi:hypothetical protein